MKNLLNILAVAVVVVACRTMKAVTYDQQSENAAQLYVDSGNHMSAVYRNGVPYYLIINSRTGKFAYIPVPISRAGNLQPVKNVGINIE